MSIYKVIAYFRMQNIKIEMFFNRSLFLVFFYYIFSMAFIILVKSQIITRSTRKCV